MPRGIVRKALLIGAGVIIYQVFLAPKVRSMLP